jgi:CMP-N,N'-diacetyllegionaminic acid synthase
MKLKSIAFIPARSGSKRIPDKNIKILSNHPMLAYSIRAAIDSNIFDAVICATDSKIYADIAKYYGAEVPFLRPSEISGDRSPDIEWVSWMLRELKLLNRQYDVFSILRPTNPFRMPETICRAWDAFVSSRSGDSLRAVQKCTQHPGKMWVLRGDVMMPIIPFSQDGTPWHSCQYQALPEIYCQDASLEIAWTKTVLEKKSISGEIVIPFISKNLEGFDINQPEDWLLAQSYLDSGQALLPLINQDPFTEKI